MIPNQLNRNQINDSSIVEEDELFSSELSGSPFKTSTVITSITSATKTVVFSSGDLIGDPRVQELDVLKVLSGPAQGIYSVDAIVDETTLTVKEVIVDDATGTSTAEIYYRCGAKITGFDPTGTNFDPTDDTVYKALNRMFAPTAISSGVFHWARSGANNGAYFYNYGSGPTPSNKVGIPLFMSPSKLNDLAIGCETDNITFTVNIYSHSGGALTLVHAQIVTLAVGEFNKTYLDLDKTITTGSMLACQLEFTIGNKPTDLQVSVGVVKS